LPIRKRITDLYGQDYKDFQKRKREGEPAKAPRKPKALERQPLLDAFARVPIGQTMSKRAWSDNYQLMFLREVFPLWGFDLALYPAVSNADTNSNVRCDGLLVIQLTKTKRGVMPKLLLKGERRFWYGRVIDWLGETNYGQ
jgi:hypothetical protein